MNTITLVLENRFKAFAADLSWLYTEAADIDAAYFATNSSGLVGALPNSTDGASFVTKLTKAQYTNGIGFIEQLGKFFNNQAVTTGDYLNNIDNLLYGSAATPVMLSAAAEALADRLKILAKKCLDLFLEAKEILIMYYNSELSAVISGVTAARVVYGANMSVGQMTQGITLVEQYKKLINNEAVATSQYSVNVGIWLTV